MFVKLNEDSLISQAEIVAIARLSGETDDKKTVYGITLVLKSGKGLDATFSDEKKRDDVYTQLVDVLSKTA